MILVDRLGQVQCDAGIGGDDPGDLLDAERDRRVEVALARRRDHRAADIAYLGVVENPLQAIAHLDTVLPGFIEKSTRTPRSVPFGTDLPFVFKSGGKLID